jgi:hypothetical protein
MKQKSYKIKTLKDIFEAVDTKNVDGFLKDFESWLRMTVALKAEQNPYLELVDASFTWIDDNKNVLRSVKFEIREKGKS